MVVDHVSHGPANGRNRTAWIPGRGGRHRNTPVHPHNKRWVLPENSTHARMEGVGEEVIGRDLRDRRLLVSHRAQNLNSACLCLQQLMAAQCAWRSLDFAKKANFTNAIYVVLPKRIPPKQIYIYTCILSRKNSKQLTIISILKATCFCQNKIQPRVVPRRFFITAFSRRLDCIALYLDEVQLTRPARQRKEFTRGKGVFHVPVVCVCEHLADFFPEFCSSFLAHNLPQNPRHTSEQKFKSESSLFSW